MLGFRSAALLLGLFSACGGIAVLEPGGGSGGGGSGGGQTAVCTGNCGSPCIKCQGDECFNGACSDEGDCVPLDQPVACPE
jgi:hypothetical protein